jgi:hypothetical protein
MLGSLYGVELPELFGFLGHVILAKLCLLHGFAADISNAYVAVEELLPRALEAVLLVASYAAQFLIHSINDPLTTRAKVEVFLVLKFLFEFFVLVL